MSHAHQRRLASWLNIRQREIEVRSFTLRDLPAVMALYHQAALDGQNIMARDEATWRWQFDYMTDIGRNDADSFLVAEADDTILGYLRLVSNAPVNWFRDDAARFSIIEYGGTDPDAAEALLAAAAACARDYNAEQIGLFVHPQSTLMTHMLAHGATMRSFTGAGFLRLNDLQQATQLMADTFQRRLSASQFAGFPIRLRLTTEDSVSEIALGNSTRPPEVVELAAPTTDMVRLLVGWFGLDNLQSGSYALRHREVLQRLFPKGDPKIAIADLI